MQTFIEIDLRVILQQLPIGKYRQSLVVKSNFYGYGYKMISYLEEYIDCIVVASLDELEFVRKENPNLKKDFIVLYDTLYKHKIFFDEENIYGVIMSQKQLDEIKRLNLDQSRFFLRCDLFVELHGLELVKCVSEVKKFKGLLLHINEYLDQVELKQLVNVDSMLKKKKLKLNLGGSIAEKYFSRLDSDLEFRFAKKLLFDYKGKKSNFCIHIQVLNVKEASCTTIGYKSCQKEIKKGWIYLVAIGYGDWPLLPRIYETDAKLIYNGEAFSVPVYPCMNTCWLYSEKWIEYDNDEIILFKTKREIIKTCEQLDIDIDEFSSSFSGNLKRLYIE